MKNVVKRLYQTLDSVTDGFVTLTKNWNIIYWNKEAEQFFNFTRDKKQNRELLISKTRGTDRVLIDKLKTAVINNRTEKFEVFFTGIAKMAQRFCLPR